MTEATIATPRRTRRTHRRLVERLVVTGQLRLLTPAHFGNGETDNFTDMPLVKDELDNRLPLLPGTSIAGALRNYLREREKGYWHLPPQPPKNNTEQEKKRYKTEMADEDKLAASLLFGGARGSEDGGQSRLIVHDALGTLSAAYELRDGVRIEPETRTAEDDKKYDITLLAAGATFGLRFDLLIGLPEGCTSQEDQRFKDYRKQLLTALATALHGLSTCELPSGERTGGEITLGARKRRGFGRCGVDGWTVRHYDLSQPDSLLAWLAADHEGWIKATTPPSHNKSIRAALKEAGLEMGDFISDARRYFALRATFALDGSLLVRSGSPTEGPDLVHLQSLRPADKGTQRRPILAGTSWAGALRSRATQIAYTLAPDEHQRMKACVSAGRKKDDQVTKLIEAIFGPEEIRTGDRNTQASRVEVAETEIGDAGIKRLEQTRIRIDRFTGGAFESALFSEEPLFGSHDSRLKLELALRLPGAQDEQAQKAELGLLLLLLKDLWTGDLPLGGEVGIGRGRLRGAAADISYAGKEWQLTQANEQAPLTVTKGDGALLQTYVDALGKEVTRHDAHS